MELRFVKMDPCGNTTVFLLDPVPRRARAAAAAAVMGPGGVGAEQVGMVDTKSDLPRLEMLGGEFCGNAARCFGAWLLLRGGKKALRCAALEEERTETVLVSGCEEPLSVRVRPDGAVNRALAEAAMPLPLSIEHGEDGELGAYSAVSFPGIDHLLLWDRTPRAEDVPRAERFLERRGLGEKCCGVLFFDRAAARLTPAVLVRDVGTLVWERSCGSGSAAAAAALSDLRGADVEALRIAQPGGELTVGARRAGGALRELLLDGPVALTAAGRLWLDL